MTNAIKTNQSKHSNIGFTNIADSADIGDKNLPKTATETEQKSTGSTPLEGVDKRLDTCSRASRGRVRKLVAEGNANAEEKAANFGIRGSTSIRNTYTFGIWTTERCYFHSITARENQRYQHAKESQGGLYIHREELRVHAMTIP